MRSVVTVDQDEDGVYVVECPAIPGCVSQGKSEEEALENIENDDQHMPSTAWELIQAAIKKARGPS